MFDTTIILISYKSEKLIINFYKEITKIYLNNHN